LTLSKAGWHASTPFATSKSIILTCKREWANISNFD
jgi:hypothetical protein